MILLQLISTSLLYQLATDDRKKKVFAAFKSYYSKEIHENKNNLTKDESLLT